MAVNQPETRERLNRLEERRQELDVPASKLSQAMGNSQTYWTVVTSRGRASEEAIGQARAILDLLENFQKPSKSERIRQIDARRGEAGVAASSLSDAMGQSSGYWYAAVRTGTASIDLLDRAESVLDYVDEHGYIPTPSEVSE